jgi:hypothetical protein
MLQLYYVHSERFAGPLRRPHQAIASFGDAAMNEHRVTFSN